MIPDRATREKSRRTRDSVLAAAERLFAQKGFEGASMRDITSAAKVNLSVAYYYFEDKEDLLLAVIEKYVFPVMEKERELLARARAESGRGAIPARRLVEALILPRMMQVSETAHQLMALLFVRRGALAQRVISALEKLTGEVRELFREEFRKTFPSLSEHELDFRMANMEAQLSGWKTFGSFWEGECSAGKISREEFFEMFIALLVQMFSAPAVLSPRGGKK